jgi:hypothetical protein
MHVLCLCRKLESLNGTRLLPLGDIHVGSEVSMLLSYEMLYAEPLIKKHNPHLAINGVAPPPPPPRTRKGSNFPLHIYGARLFKQQMITGVGMNASDTVRNKRSCTMVGTMDGALGCLVPLDEKMYKRLALLQQIMSMLLPSTLALNPRDYRIPVGWKSKYPFLQATTGRKIVLDGCVLFQFLDLDHAIQEELAHTLGVTAFFLRENLHEIDYLSRFF